jgi:hypothetical protein
VRVRLSLPRRDRVARCRQIGRDLAYIPPGILLSLVPFTVLIPFFFLRVGTVIIWIGLAVLRYLQVRLT